MGGVVSVAGLRTRPTMVLLWLECSPGGSMVAAEALTQRQDTTFTYLMTGGADVVAEIGLAETNLGPALLTQIPATTGLVWLVSYPFSRTSGPSAAGPPAD